MNLVAGRLRSGDGPAEPRVAVRDAADLPDGEPLGYSVAMTMVLLTGSTRGIGAAAFAALTAGGATVIGHGSRGDDSSIGVDLAAPGGGDRLWDEAKAAERAGTSDAG